MGGSDHDSHDDDVDEADAHDAHDDHEPFDPEPAEELGKDEAPTPNWVPLVGLGVFLLGGIYFVSEISDEETDGAPNGGSAPPAQIAPAARPNAAPPSPAGAAPRGAAPTPDRPQFNEDAMERARKALDAQQK